MMRQRPQVLFQEVRDTAKCARLFLHEHPCDAWSRGVSFVNEMAEKDGVHKTKVELCRFQLAPNSIEKGSWFISNSECIIEELASLVRSPT